jgi:membrane protein
MDRDLRRRINRWLWERDLDPLRRTERVLIRLLRIAFVAIRDLADGQLTMRAMGLVYTTLLSMVPLLAISFSLLKALGVHNQIEPMLRRLLAPLGDAGPEITQNVIGFVEKIQVGVLGTAGIALLLYAAISLIQKVESGCNYIWKVDRPRSFGRRFSEYLSVLVVAPVVVFSALAMTATITSQTLVQRIVEIEPFGLLYYTVGRLVPYMLLCGGFTLLYRFIPNTRVRMDAAVVGGIAAGVMWQSASLLFATFVRGATNYDAIYSGFAIVIFLLIWLYVSWLILLIGCHIAFLWQRPEHVLRDPKILRMGGRMTEHLALLIMALVASNLVRREPPWREESLARELRVPPEHLYRVLDLLLAGGLLAQTSDEQPRLLPLCDMDTLTVREILDVVRRSDAGLGIREQAQIPHPQAAAAMQKVEQSMSVALDGLTLRQLLESEAVAPRTERWRAV